MTPTLKVEDSLFGVVLQDSYRIVGRLGEGGMGAVYEAVHVRLQKRVAIKVMARDLASNSEALNRFHREALITSGLGHPHIVQVFDFATTPDGQPFLAMEFLDGEDLDHRMARVRCLSLEQTVQIVKQVASALAATHVQQIVHRDLKPANIFLLRVAGEADFVKVLDFGISKIRAAVTKITRASAIIGTPDYMSPEQAMGSIDEVDERTDQWALACIAWECLSGRPPFAGDSVPSMLFQVVHREPPSLMAKVPGLPGGVELVLRRALAKKKGERFSGVTAFAQALEHAATYKAEPVLVGTAIDEPGTETIERPQKTEVVVSPPFADRMAPQTDPAARWAGRPTWQWVVAGASLTAALVVAVLLLWPTGMPTSPARPSPAPRHAEPPQTAPAPPTAEVALSPTPPLPVEARPSPPAKAEPESTPEGAGDDGPAAADARSNSHTSKPTPGARTKAKPSKRERRLIKEL